MTKSEAIKILMADFHNQLIAQGWENIDDTDRAIAKALKIEIPS
jgi:hypothetical protein